MSDGGVKKEGLTRCLRCKDFLTPSGKEPHRLVCPSCGQNFFVVLQLIPVDPRKATPMLGVGDAEQRTESG